MRLQSFRVLQRDAAGTKREIDHAEDNRDRDDRTGS